MALKTEKNLKTSRQLFFPSVTNKIFFWSGVEVSRQSEESKTDATIRIDTKKNKG